MNKEQFLNELKKNIRDLTPDAINEEIQNYEKLKKFDDLNPIEEANKIYAKRGIKKTVSGNIKFFEAANILVNYLRGNDKEKIKNILLFFLYIFILIIFIKVPFIYVRDMLYNLFNNIFSANMLYIIFELFYAVVAIYIFIKQVKDKAIKLEQEKNTK